MSSWLDPLETLLSASSMLRAICPLSQCLTCPSPRMQGLGAAFSIIFNAIERVKCLVAIHVRMSGSTQVIRATQMFTKDGASKKVSLVREMITGFSLGIGFGLIWKVCWLGPLTCFC